MTELEAQKVLMMVKAIWFKQPTDDVTIRVWYEILEHIDYESAKTAVSAYVDLASENPPNVAQIRHEAREIAGRKVTAQRQLAYHDERDERGTFTGGKAPGWYNPSHRLFDLVKKTIKKMEEKN